jgi:hypothetical protein
MEADEYGHSLYIWHCQQVSKQADNKLKNLKNGLKICIDYILQKIYGYFI